MKLNIGCGEHVKEGYLNVDIEHHEGVDMMAAAENLPFDNNSFEKIIATNILEHVEDLVSVMKELHRVLKPEGIIRIISPHYTSSGSWKDPTHKRALSVETFTYFVKGHRNSKYYRFGFGFSSIKTRLRFGRKMPLNWVVSPLANRFPKIYESTFLSAFPCMDMVVELKK